MDINMQIRLQKFLSDAGIGSRRFCESLISNKEILVNGQIAELGCKVGLDDEVIYKSEIIHAKKNDLKVILLNKPNGVLSSSINDRNRPIVFDLLPKSESRPWISIGRLDVNSSGLMLFTNNGGFANYCMHPSNGFDKEYLVRARGNFNQKVKDSMLNGINLDGKIYKFSDIVEGEKKGTNQWFSVCLISGKNREVRKLFNAFDLEVSRLKRTRFGPIFLPSGLRPGKFLELSNNEIQSIKDYHQS